MSIGTAIFWSSCLIASVLLYGFTRDRWPWRRIIFGLLTAVILLVVGVAGFMRWTDRRDEARKAEREATEREEHEVGIGDDLATVLRRHGPPDTTVTRDDGGLGFGYGPRYGSTRPINKVFLCDPDSSLTDIRFIGDAMSSIEFGWIPRDRVRLGLRRAQVIEALGRPCSEDLEDRFTRLIFPTEDSSVVRYVRLEHGEQRVSLHGWARRSCPDP